MKLTKFTRRLDDDVRFRVEFTKHRGEIIEFVAQLEVKLREHWGPVIRYDTAHGFPHCDRYTAAGDVRRHEPMPTDNFNDALTLAIRSILKHWEQWAREFREASS